MNSIKPNSEFNINPTTSHSPHLLTFSSGAKDMNGDFSFGSTSLYQELVLH